MMKFESPKNEHYSQQGQENKESVCCFAPQKQRADFCRRITATNPVDLNT